MPLGVLRKVLKAHEMSENIRNSNGRGDIYKCTKGSVFTEIKERGGESHF